MKDDNYRIWVEDLGTFVSKQTKHSGPEGRMKRRRNSIQAFLDRTYGDGRWRVYIAPDDPREPIMKQNRGYHVYNRHGYWQGTYQESVAKRLVEQNEDWTMAEVNNRG
jgi:hypothetical protein